MLQRTHHTQLHTQKDVTGLLICIMQKLEIFNISSSFLGVNQLNIWYQSQNGTKS